jgi:hypothetical protein
VIHTISPNLATASYTRRAPLSRSRPSPYREYLTTHARNGTTAAEWRACNAQVRAILCGIPNSGVLVTLLLRRSLTVISFARLRDHCCLSTLMALFPLPISCDSLTTSAIAPAMTCVNNLACLELLHPGFYAVACIGVPGPKTPPTKNSPPYRHPMPTFYRLALNSFSLWSTCISKTPLCSDHPLSVMPMLSHHVDARTPC